VIVPSCIQRKHDLARPYIQRIADRAGDLVRRYCEGEGFAYVGRMKDTESLAEKIESGRYQSWGAMDDFFACSIIVPTVGYEPEALSFLATSFHRIALRHRSENKKDPAVFRYDATRFIGTLKGEPDLAPESELLKIRFEVQIRTAFEHAWSVTTHALAYKGDCVDWRRMRLAAQLKASVEQLDLLIAGYEEVATGITTQQWPEIAAKGSIESFFRQKVDAGQVPSEAIPRSWVRFCDNLFAMILSASDQGWRDPEGTVTAALGRLEAELASTSPAAFPRSLSLLQVSLGSLVRCGVIARPLNRYTPLVTRELLSIYPEADVLGAGFNVELDGS
jgi:hypothetical protein